MLGDPSCSREVWFVLHGYRQLAERFIGAFQALPGAGETRAVVAPEALSRFYIESEVGPHDGESRVGATWMTRADREHEIRDYVEYLDRVAGEVLVGGAGSATGAEAPDAAPLDAGDRRVVVLGFSQGAETASRWVTYGRIRPAELVLWGGGLAVDVEAADVRDALAGVEVRLVSGSGDRWGLQRGADTEARLREVGIVPERVRYEGGHVVAPEVLAGSWPIR